MHRVGTREQGGVAFHRVQQQAFVGGEDVVRGQVGVAEVHADFFGVKARAGALQAEAHGDAFVRLDADDEFVFRRVLVEDRVRRGFEVDDDFGEAHRQVFAGADVKRHAAPAPVVDLQAQRHVGFGGAVRRDAFFLAVGQDFFVADAPLAVLGEDEVGFQVFVVQRVQAVQHFGDFVAHGVGIDQRRRFHRHHGQYLQQVVLEHVAHRARAVVVAAAVFHADGFGGGDFNVVNVVAVPERLEEAVGEAQHEEVLHGFFAEVVVDAVYLVFVEVVVDGAVEVFRGLAVVAEGFFYNQPLPAALFVVQAMRGEAFRDDAVEARRGGEVVDGVAARFVFMVQRVQSRQQFGVVFAVGGVDGLVIEVGAEGFQRLSVRPFFFDEVAAHRFAEGVVIQLGAADAQDGEFFR